MLNLFLALNKSPSTPENCLFIEGDSHFNSQSPEDFSVKFRLFLDDLKNLKYLDHLSYFIPPHASQNEKARALSYFETAERVRREIWKALGETSDSLLGIRNFFNNLRSIVDYPDLCRIQVKKHFHAVVVATGPSLDLETDLLRELQKKALLISVDASLKTLLSRGIVPDMVVAVERDDYSIPFFQNLPKDLTTLFVGQPTVDKKIFHAYPGPIAVTRKYSGPFLWLPTKGAQFWSGSSAAHLCYRIACYLGASSVALVGQDLAYHPETLQSHSEVKDYPDWQESESFENRKSKNKAFFVKGNTYEKVLTNPFWDLFAHEYSFIVRETKVPTVNTSRLGRQIEGIAYESLESWMKRIKPNDLNWTCPIQNPEREQDEKKIRAKTQNALIHLNQLKKELFEMSTAKEIYLGMFKRPHFLELVFENVIRDYVIAENKIFSLTEIDAIDRVRFEFLKKIEPVVLELISILESAQI